ncbi:hypothetical protein CABS01_11440 [Colletotrichum abscissum]|uniref:uncharacterized protein n=1 Tax=Colletotrichum abscissum TaxID=1671311 RepID=UPI0027D577CA|nr:uncharacterized protein CABS01_11440 [Colletotrichum abscissum]KAK1494424.1 hypothetical protein CABS01_11440 [Colletotrichum abscissum]
MSCRANGRLTWLGMCDVRDDFHLDWEGSKDRDMEAEEYDATSADDLGAGDGKERSETSSSSRVDMAVAVGKLPIEEGNFLLSWKLQAVSSPRTRVSVFSHINLPNPTPTLSSISSLSFVCQRHHSIPLPFWTNTHSASIPFKSLLPLRNTPLGNIKSQATEMFSLSIVTLTLAALGIASPIDVKPRHHEEVEPRHHEEIQPRSHNVPSFETLKRETTTNVGSAISKMIPGVGNDWGCNHITAPNPLDCPALFAKIQSGQKDGVTVSTDKTCFTQTHGTCKATVCSAGGVDNVDYSLTTARMMNPIQTTCVVNGKSGYWWNENHTFEEDPSDEVPEEEEPQDEDPEDEEDSDDDEESDDDEDSDDDDDSDDDEDPDEDDEDDEEDGDDDEDEVEDNEGDGDDEGPEDEEIPENSEPVEEEPIEGEFVRRRRRVC